MFPCKFMYFIHLLTDSYYSLNYLKKTQLHDIYAFANSFQKICNFVTEKYVFNSKIKVNDERYD